MEKSRIYSLSALAKLVEGGFHELFDEFLFWCTAEVGSVKQYGSRYYVDLFEYDKAGSVKTKITGIVRTDSVLESFLTKTNNTTQSLQGKEIMLQGYFSYSIKRGLSISILGISQEYEQGKQQTALQILEATLQKEGIFTANKQKFLPVLPKNIAVISSIKSQGLLDFQSILKESNYGVACKIFHATVEGDGAINSVKQAFELIGGINQSGEFFDCIILLRGGGGSESFARQNSEPVVRAVCNGQIPIVIAIGHTSDSSMLDKVAFHTCKTPSEAAMRLVSKYQLIDKRIQEQIQAINTSYKRNIEIIKETVHQRFSTIMLLGVNNVLEKGYALIRDADNNPLTHDQLESLAAGDAVEIETFKNRLKATINSVQNK